MSTDAIFEKYMQALSAVTADGGWVEWPAVRLALRLAIGDAYDAGLLTCGGMHDDLAAIVASQNKALQGALEQIDPLREERNALHGQLAQMDADNADLLNKVHQAQLEIDRLTRLNEIATDAFNSLYTNGNSVDPTAAARSLEATDWGRNHPAWQALPAADLAVIDQISSGLITFRRMSKTLRRDLVVRVIRHLASQYGGTISSSVWDHHRPHWMPTQGAVIALTDGGKWSSLLRMALEPIPA
jgi:hypothetical protein